MVFLKPIFAAILAIVFLSQITMICAGPVQPDIRIMPNGSVNVDLLRRNQSDGLPARSSDVGLLPRQASPDDWRYFGHRCRLEAKTDPVPSPGKWTCNPPPHGKFNDAREHKLLELADYFCENYFDGRNGTAVQDPVRMPITRIFWRTTQSKESWPQNMIYAYGKNMEPHNNVWSFAVDWIYGCSTDDLPIVERNECVEHLHSAWRGCTNNKGQGGKLEIGCLRWTAEPVY